MRPWPEQHDPADTGAACREEHDLCTRVRAEFQEMPGLTLTLPQASRLFSIEPESLRQPSRRAQIRLIQSDHFLLPQLPARALSGPADRSAPNVEGRHAVRALGWSDHVLRNENGSTEEPADAEVVDRLVRVRQRVLVSVGRQRE